MTIFFYFVAVVMKDGGEAFAVIVRPFHELARGDKS